MRRQKTAEIISDRFVAAPFRLCRPGPACRTPLPFIPSRTSRKEPREPDRDLCARRDRVERFFGRIKEFLSAHVLPVGFLPQSLHLQPPEVRNTHSLHAWGMIFRRWRASTNSSSRGLIIRIARRWFTGIREWAMHTTKPFRMKATTLGINRLNSASRPSATSLVLALEGG